MDLGLESSFSKLPAQISIGDSSYFLVRNQNGYLLLSTMCPHRGGVVYDRGSSFQCPDHDWQFDRTNGECINEPMARLAATPVRVRDGHLFIDGSPLEPQFGT